MFASLAWQFGEKSPKIDFQNIRLGEQQVFTTSYDNINFWNILFAFYKGMSFNDVQFLGR